jgi:uncharacterized protein
MKRFSGFREPPNPFAERKATIRHRTINHAQARSDGATFLQTETLPMIAIVSHPEGSLLAVRAQPGARKSGVVGEQGDALKVAVTAPPEDGRANQAITELLRDWLGLKRSQVELAAGATNRNKQFLIRGLKPDELGKRIEERLGDSA